MVLYTPKSKVLEFNDKLDYIMLCTDTKTEYSREWQKLRENEFVLKPVITEDPEVDTYHLKMDRFNGYIRLKTAANKDKGDDGYLRLPEGVDEKDLPAELEFQQGLEIRDGRAGEEDGAWVELIDGKNRGIWFSEKQKAAVFRTSRGKDQCIILEDENKEVIIKNTDGKVFIDVTRGPVQVRTIDGDIALKAGKNLYLEGENVYLNATGGGGAQASLTSIGLSTNKDMYANTMRGNTIEGAAGRPGATFQAVDPNIPQRVAPTDEDRAKTTQDEQEEVDEKIITGETINGEDESPEAPESPEVPEPPEL
jgi:hypothetical protein